MGMFTLQCGSCGAVEEYIMYPVSGNKTASCVQCGTKLDYAENRRVDIDYVTHQIQGDTVAGGCSYDYYDENLDTHISSKHQRAEEMKRQGLSDYSHDPDFASHRDNINYIRKNAKKGDTEARDALRKEKKELNDKRTKRNVGRALKGSFHKAGL